LKNELNRDGGKKDIIDLSVIFTLYMKLDGCIFLMGLNQFTELQKVISFAYKALGKRIPETSYPG
jgi:hypothetical protein